MIKFALVLLFTISTAFALTCNPVSLFGSVLQAENFGRLFVAFEKTIYKIRIPSLEIESQATLANNMCSPAVFRSERNYELHFATSNENSETVVVDTTTLTTLSVTAGANEFPPTYSESVINACTDPQLCQQLNIVNYRVEYTAADNSFTQSLDGNQLGEKLSLPGTDNTLVYMSYSVDGYVDLLTRSCQGRGCGNMHFSRINIAATGPTRATQGLKELPNTGVSGCPVPPDQCSVPVLLDFTVELSMIQWLWSIKNGDNYEVHTELYDIAGDSFTSGTVPTPSSTPSSVAPRSTTAPSTTAPSTAAPSTAPSTAAPSQAPSTNAPSTTAPTTSAPSTVAPTQAPSTTAPTTSAPTEAPATSAAPSTPVTSAAPTTVTTLAPGVTTTVAPQVSTTVRASTTRTPTTRVTSTQRAAATPAPGRSSAEKVKLGFGLFALVATLLL